MVTDILFIIVPILLLLLLIFFWKKTRQTIEKADKAKEARIKSESDYGSPSVMPGFMKGLARGLLVIMLAGSLLIGLNIGAITSVQTVDISIKIGIIMYGIICSLIAFGIIYSIGCMLEWQEIKTRLLYKQNKMLESHFKELKQSKSTPDA